MGRWSFCLVARFDNDFLFQSGLFVRFYFVGNTFQEIFKLDLTGCFRDNYCVEGVPFAYQVAFLHFVVIVEVQLGAVGYVVRQQDNPGIGINNPHFHQTAHYHLVGFAFSVLGFYEAKLVEFQDTVVLGDDPAFGGNVGSDTSHVKRT